MLKEKKEMFNNNTFYKLLKFLSDTKIKGYEICNIVDDDGYSIFSANIDELAKDEGQVFISEDKLNEMIQKELDKRFGKKEVDI